MKSEKMCKIENKTKSWIYVIVVLLAVTLSFSSVLADTVKSKAGVSYEPEILEEFNKTDKVWIMVRLKDNSNIPIGGRKRRAESLYRQKCAWFDPVINKILVTLLEDEFEFTNRYFNGFAGKITHEGFNKLIKNQAVRMVHLSGVLHIAIPGLVISDEVNTTKNLSVSENGSLADVSFEADAQTKQESWLSNLLSKIVQFIKSLFSK